MYDQQIFLGTWDDVSRLHASELQGRQVEIRVLDRPAHVKSPRMIYEGMFPQLAVVGEADFEAAQWRGPRDGEI
jgi:hypothetical protein